MATSAQPASRLPSECFLHPESDDEESFVVLGTSLPPESLTVDCGNEAIEIIQPTTVQQSLDLTASTLAHLNISSSSLPSLPKMNERDLIINLQGSDTATTANSSVDLSHDEIQQKVDSLIDENSKLKDTLHQNNLAMKKHQQMLLLWQEDVMKVHQSHKERYADAKKYIENLKIENGKLHEALHSIQSKPKEEEKVSENATDECSVKSSLSDMKELEIESLRSKMSDLEAELSQVRSAKEAEKQQSVQPPSLSDQVQDLEKELVATKQLNAQVAADFAKQRHEGEELQKILLEEIKVLKSQLSEKMNGYISKEEHENIKEQLMAAQMHITKLELLRNEDKDIINVKEETIIKLQAIIKEMTEANDAMPALRAQLELYKADFEAERQAKEQMAEDLQHLQNRNQQLLEEVERLRNGDFVHVKRSDVSRVTSASSPSAPQNSPPPRTYMCPVCSMRFRSLRLLESHVEYCILNTP